MNMLVLILVILTLTSCSTPKQQPTATSADTPVPTTVRPTHTPQPASCAEVEGTCMELSFDGESCTYIGPSDLKPGSVTILFINDSEANASMNLVRHKEGKTIEDMLETFVDGYAESHHPSWTEEIRGVFRNIPSGRRHIWEGDLKSGIHTLVCARLSPLGVWFGTGLTVED